MPRPAVPRWSASQRPPTCWRPESGPAVWACSPGAWSRPCAARRDSAAVCVGPVWRAYSPLAAASTVVLLATGLLEAGHHLPGLGAVTSTVYGAGVAAKTVLMVVALGLAAVNTAVVHPELAARAGMKLPYGMLRRLTLGSPRRFAATVTAEAAVLGLAVALAAVVTSTPTSREYLDARRPTTVHVERADGLFVTFEEVPGGPAKGRLIVRLRSIVRPDPAPVTGVDVDLGGQSGHVLVPLARTDPDRYEGTTAEPGPGTWTATVHVHRTNAADTVTSSSWTVDPKAADSGLFEVVTTALAASAALAARSHPARAAPSATLRRRSRARPRARPRARECTSRREPDMRMRPAGSWGRPSPWRWPVRSPWPPWLPRRPLRPAHPGARRPPRVVTLKDGADLRGIRGTRKTRLRVVKARLRQTADADQAPLIRSLAAAKAQGRARVKQSLWISNSLVLTATPDVLAQVAARPDVASVVPDNVTLTPADDCLDQPDQRAGPRRLVLG